MTRMMSWSFGALAYVAPVLWIRHEWFGYVRDVKAQGDFVCGMPLLAMVPVAALLATAFSCVALLTGWLALRTVATPRPPLRTVELLVLAIPLVAWDAFTLLFLSGP